MTTYVASDLHLDEDDGSRLFRGIDEPVDRGSAIVLVSAPRVRAAPPGRRVAPRS